MDGISSTAGVLALVATAIALVAVAIAIVAVMRLRRVVRDQRRVLGESGERDLVAHATAVEETVAGLYRRLEQLAVAVGRRLDGAERRLDGAVSRTAVVRYDAFNETSGRQSSSVALLDDRGDGVVLSAILRRDEARVYVKPVRSGSSALDLSPEEEESVRDAMAGDRDGEPA